MDREIVRVFGFIAFGIVIVLGLLAIIHLASTLNILGSDGAAWVQAIGSVAAIAVAVELSRRQNDSALALNALQHQNSLDLIIRTAEAAHLRNLHGVMAIFEAAEAEAKALLFVVLGEGMRTPSDLVRNLINDGHTETEAYYILLRKALSNFAGRPPYAQLTVALREIPMHGLESHVFTQNLYELRKITDEINRMFISLNPDNVDEPKLHALGSAIRGAFGCANRVKEGSANTLAQLEGEPLPYPPGST